jgi:hypothetical protein
MSTKKLVKPTPRVPVVKFFVCEDLRQEVNGMVSAIGLYPDNVIVIAMPDGIPDPTTEAPVAVKSLSFLFNISNFSATSSVTIEIESKGKRSLLLPVKEYPAPESGKSINLIANMQPGIFHFFGERKVFIAVGESVHEFHYEVRRVSLTGNTLVREPENEAAVAKSPKRPSRKTQ